MTFGIQNQYGIGVFLKIEIIAASVSKIEPFKNLGI